MSKRPQSLDEAWRKGAMFPRRDMTRQEKREYDRQQAADAKRKARDERRAEKAAENLPETDGKVAEAKEALAQTRESLLKALGT